MARKKKKQKKVRTNQEITNKEILVAEEASEKTTEIEIENRYERYRYCEVKEDDRNSDSCVLEEIFGIE